MEKHPRERLRAERESRQASIAEFAAEIGCSASSLGMIELGYRWPGLEHALGIQRVVGIEPREWTEARKASRKAG